MKLCLTTGHLSDDAGGFSASIPGLAKGLSAIDSLECHIIGLRDPRKPHAWQRWGENVHAVEELGPHAFGFAPDYKNTLSTLSPDLVDAQGLWMYPSLANLRHSIRTGSSYVLTPRGMLDPWAVVRSGWKKRLASWGFENEHLHRAACLRATAPMEARHIRAYGRKNPIAVVPNGIDLSILGPRPDYFGRKYRLLFLSRLHPKKGIAHLLRAWAGLRHRHGDWELVIAGPDELGHRAEMQRLAANLGVRDVIWHKAVLGEAKTVLYRSADLFVLPTHAENFGLVVAEALAHEVPVITTKNAPWDGLEGQGCGWWIELSDDALTTALDDAMSASDFERHAMGARGRAWMGRDFSWPAIARQMHAVYTWVLGGGSPPACIVTD